MCGEMSDYDMSLRSETSISPEEDIRPLPEKIVIEAELVRELAYAENRDQNPAGIYVIKGINDPLSFGLFEPMVEGDKGGYINWVDGDRALNILCAIIEASQRAGLREPFLAIPCKHGQPSGIGWSWDDPNEAIRLALNGDSVAVMGAELMVNFAVDRACAQSIINVPESLFDQVGRKFWGVDVVYAPLILPDSAEALTIPRKNDTKRRLIVNAALASPTSPTEYWHMRFGRGVIFLQRRPWYVPEFAAAQDAFGWSQEELADLIIAWAAARFSVSNTVSIAGKRQLLALGDGQRDRLFCAEICLLLARRNGKDVTGGKWASDAFFPFDKRKRPEDPFEATELLVQAGCTGGIVPFDGNNRELVKAYLESRNQKVLWLPKEHRMFFGH
jgi:AICAR transformylase/IMP cyclohydrolase PurH